MTAVVGAGEGVAEPREECGYTEGGYNLLQGVGGDTHPINDTNEAGEGPLGSNARTGDDGDKEEHESEDDVEDDFATHVGRIGTREFRRWSGLARDDWHCRRRKGEKCGSDDEQASRGEFRDIRG